LSLSSDTPVAGPSRTLSPPLPAYQPPQYLATIAEYLPIPEDVEMDADDDDDETEEQKAEWRDERFESLLPRGMDPVFERFLRRIDSAEEGSTQVLRYDLGGVPLPYSSGSPLTKKLFPTLPPTKPDDEDPPYEEHYTPATVPACKSCGGKRVFELQLVPSLISVLVPSAITTTGKEPEGTKEVKAMSEEQRKEELAKLASGEEGGGEGMEWGTVMVFGCEKDCVGFREEWVGVEWEATLSHAR
jgi:pre-rRNA-processing protein TSR4